MSRSAVDDRWRVERPPESAKRSDQRGLDYRRGSAPRNMFHSPLGARVPSAFGIAWGVSCTSQRWPTRPPGRSVSTNCSNRLARAGWAKCIAPATPGWGDCVAIKFLSADLRDSPAAAARLDREARLASSLNHPGIVTVYDVGRIDGRPYVVMELIVGRSLAARLAAGPLELQDALDIAWQVSDALAAAHAGGVVHRDLKPQNVMLTTEGRAEGGGLRPEQAWRS